MRRRSTPTAPPYGDRELTDKTNRLSYVYGVMLNKQGLRFVDEGEDQNLYTYAKFGGTILNQPGTIAWQIFDSKAVALLEPRYSTGRPIVADTLDGLVARLGLDRSGRDAHARPSTTPPPATARSTPACATGCIRKASRSRNRTGRKSSTRLLTTPTR